MKLIKILAALFAGALLLLGGMGAYVVATFNPNNYKPQVIQLVKDKKQRTLKLDGDIRLKFWPNIGADLGKASLSEFKSEAEFASVENVRVSLKLLPLLSKKIVVDEVEVRGVRATLVKLKDGTLNIADLLSEDDKPSEAVAFDIDHVSIANANLIYRDEKERTSLALLQVNVKTGRIASNVPGKVDLSFTVSSDQPKMNLGLSLKTRLTFDLDQQVYSLEGLSLDAKGRAADISNLNAKASGSVTAELKTGEFTTQGLSVAFTGVSGKDNLDIKFDTPKLLITKDKASGDKVTVNAKISNAQGVTTARVEWPGLEGTAQAFTAAAMTLDLDMKQGEQSVRATVRSPLSGNLHTQQISLPQLTVSVTVAGPNLPGKSLAGSLSGSASVNGAKQQAQANLAGKFADTTIKAQLGVNGFAPPGLNFDIDIDQLDLDKYAPSTQTAGGAMPGTEKPIDVSALRSLRAHGKVRIGLLKMSNIKASNVRLDIRAAGGQVDVSTLSANLYEGAMNGAISVNAAGAAPRFAIRQNLSEVSIGPLLKDVANKDALEGKGTVNIDVNTQGATVGALKRVLAGNAAVALRDGAVKGIDIAGTIRDARARLGTLKGQQTQPSDKNRKTDFSELNATFAIQNGIARNNDLSLKSPLLRVNGEGDINIGEDTVNYLVKASIVGSLTGQDGRDIKALKGVTVPVRATGPMTAPSFALDFNAMVTDTVKQKAEEVIRGKLEEAVFGKKPAAPTAPAASDTLAKPGAAPAVPAAATGNAHAPKSGRDAATDVLKGIFGR